MNLPGLAMSFTLGPVEWIVAGYLILTLITNLFLIVKPKRRKPLSEPVKFPFTLSDLLYWIIVHTDGTTVKYVYRDPLPTIKAEVKGEACNYPKRLNSGPSWNPSASTSPRDNYSLSAYCDHTPTPDKPLWTSPDSKLSLCVADAEGVKDSQDLFDYIIDCGDVLSIWHPPYQYSPTLEGDLGLVKGLNPYLSTPDAKHDNPHTYKLLKIKWWDRKAPPVQPEFWVHLYNQLMKKGGDVVTNCQGGHGRSGTAFCCLMMVGSPDYGSLDAIIHLRALHCARAIEGVDQHLYLDKVATYLKREANAAGMKEITSFKEAFAQSTKPTAVRIKALIENQAAVKAAPVVNVSANK